MPPSKRGITRSRSGCVACRRRHTKCDEARPHCQNCVRAKVECPGYAPVIHFRDATEAVGQRSRTIESRKWAAIRERDGQERCQAQTQSRQSRRPEKQHEATADEDDEPPRGFPSPEQSSADSTTGAHEYDQPFQQKAYSPATSNLHIVDADLGSDACHHEPWAWSQSPNHAALLEPATASTAATLTSRPSDAGMPGSFNFPPRLPAVFKTIWEGAGYSNVVLKYALMAAVPLAARDIDGAEFERGDRLRWYSWALLEMARVFSATAKDVAQAAVQVTILLILVVVEIRYGTMAGARAHFAQVELLIDAHLTSLTAWETGCQLIRAWISVKSQYSINLNPWDPDALPPPDDIHQTVRAVFRADPNKGQQLLPILVESDRLNRSILLGRLVGPNAAWPGYNAWQRQLEELGIDTPPPEGFYTPGADEDRLAQLSKELDLWHDSLDLADMPIHVVTAGDSSRHTDAPDPLRFRSHEAAMAHLHYAAAQALCSRELLDAATGGDLARERSQDKWLSLILRILAGMDASACAYLDVVGVGIAWFFMRVVVTLGLDGKTRREVQALLPWLDQVRSSCGGTIPRKDVLRRILDVYEEERRGGRQILAMILRMSLADEVWSFRDGTNDLATVVMGRVVETGASFRYALRLNE
ncbi:hypothetical protein B0T10DRAFT_412688 [Thelonectria olida]|uniref:Zn(2)-C6 fungal-type domain-containing protein n=1 Tax=Thelonectria olida TaxID=1576542 RepID=A0A9P9AKX4_9HYPO|nr:hypothetical protein B0T10DRAFT_412688 [Thelonectria olida]